HGIRRAGRSTRTVDANDDGSYGAVAADLADVFSDRFRPRDRAIERVVSALAARNRADNVDNGNAGTAIEPHGAQADASIFIPVDLTRSCVKTAGLGAFQLLQHLVFVHQVVNEAGAERVFRQKRSFVDEAPHVGLALAPAIGYAANELIEKSARERFI